MNDDIVLEVPHFLRELPSLRNAPRGFDLFEVIIVLLGCSSLYCEVLTQPRRTTP